MSNAALFTLSASAGAALLALWLDTRFPGLAPATLARRLAAIVAACVAVEAGAWLFERVLAWSVTPPLRGLLALGVLLPALLFSFLACIWILRSLQEVARLR